MTTRLPITAPCAWCGDELARSTRWIRTLGADDVAAIDTALAGARARNLAWSEITRENFPLPGLGRLLADMRAELEDGSGVLKLRGLPVGRYEPEDLRRIWYGIGCNLGRPVHQNRFGELMRDIRDEGAGIGDKYGKVERKAGGTFLSSYARTLSNGPLRFHTDRCDVVGLLCVRQAGSGGLSRLASSVAIHNEMLRTRPDLLELLFQDFPRSRFGEEATRPEEIYHLPIFGLRDGKFTSHYSLTFIEAAEMVPGVKKLTEDQRAAIALLMKLADELAFNMMFEPGDMQFLNNHVVYHARTAFTDDAPAGRDRLLYRLWLTMPNNRPLPVGHEVLWGRIEAGQPRGGIGQAG